MNSYFKKCVIVFLVLILAGSFLSWAGSAAFGQDKIEAYVSALEQTKEGMTLWDMLKSGGVVMIVLGALSVAAGAVIIYNFMSLQEEKLAPQKFFDDLIHKLEQKKGREVKEMCKSGSNVIARIVTAGVTKRTKGSVFVREAMENCTKNEIGALWQNISYLSDIAAIAPLVGLLGTVLGMIQAFNVIAFQTAVVKPILLAGGVSKAMVTTAGGLIVAIPVMLFYAYFRGRVQQLENSIETYSADLIKIVEEGAK